MLHSLIWECNGIRLEFSTRRMPGFFADLDNVVSNASGVFDRRSAPGVDGTRTYAAALSGAQIAREGTVLAYNMGSRSRSVDRVLVVPEQLCDAFNPRFTGKSLSRPPRQDVFLYARAVSTRVSESFPEVLCRSALTCMRMTLTGTATRWRKFSWAFHPPIRPSGRISGKWGGMCCRFRPISPTRAKTRFTRWCGSGPVVKYPNPAECDHRQKAGVEHAHYRRVLCGCRYRSCENTVTLWRKTEQGYEEIDNVTYWLTLDSTPDFYLQPGENLLRVDNAVARGISVGDALLWYERELGV